MKRCELLKCQLWRISQRKPDETSASSRVHGKNEFGSKGATLRLADTTPANFDPLFTRVLISRERHELPSTTSLAIRVDRDEITPAKALPARAARDDDPRHRTGLFHVIILADAVASSVLQHSPIVQPWPSNNRFPALFHHLG